MKKPLPLAMISSGGFWGVPQRYLACHGASDEFFIQVRERGESCGTHLGDSHLNYPLAEEFGHRREVALCIGGLPHRTTFRLTDTARKAARGRVTAALTTSPHSIQKEIDQ
jgi:hypothetical protein